MPYTNKIRIDTTDYIWTHGRNPRGTGAWAFFIGCRDNLDKLYFALLKTRWHSNTLSENMAGPEVLPSLPVAFQKKQNIVKILKLFCLAHGAWGGCALVKNEWHLGQM